MATKPVDEEAHFRIDDLTRQLTDRDSAAEAVMEALQMVHAQVQKDIEDLREVVKEVQRMNDIRQFGAAFMKLAASLETISQSMATPKSRSGVVKLPSGDVTMHIQEH
jgi:signal transduction histidine kinase